MLVPQPQVLLRCFGMWRRYARAMRDGTPVRDGGGTDGDDEVRTASFKRLLQMALS